MITINTTFSFKQIINKSTFICTLIPITSNEEAMNALSEVRKKYYDATHNCYAYIWGIDGEYARYSDDGEPSQTAGVVILDVLKKNELTNVLAIVTRYFGGIKLGASGLVRAYSSTTAGCVKYIDPSLFLHLLECSDMEINVSYTNYNRINRYLTGYKEKEKEFLEEIKIIIIVPTSDIDVLKRNLIEGTKGQINIKISEPIKFFG